MLQHHDAPTLATAADIEELEHHEVVSGEIVQKASPSMRHGVVQANLVGYLFPFQRRRGGGGGGWWLVPECTIELDCHEVYQPDIAGWRVERLPTVPNEFPVRLPPDWVSEVLSPSTAGRDLSAKRRGYHRAKVMHYWIVDPFNQTLSVLRWRESEYALIQAAGPGEVMRAEPFEAVELDVSALLGFD